MWRWGVSGLAVGLGLNFRLGARNGRAVGILIGASVGVAVMPFASFIGRGPGFLVAAVLALAVGLMEGLGTSRLRGYRDAVLESLLVSTLLGLGLAFSPLGPNGLVVSLWCVPANAILAGFFSRDSSGRRFARPPNWLLASYLAVFALIVLVTSVERHPRRPLPEALVIAAVTAVLVPVAVFCSAWRLAAWLRPRLRVYLQLADYLR